MRKLVVASLIILAVACSPKRDNMAPDAASCSSGDPPRCEGTAYQVCQGGEYVTEEVCPVACSETLGGCAECDPAEGPACDGNQVVSCNPDGTHGPVLETCEAGEECRDGQCARACTADGVDLIYVVDNSNNFLSFDPRKIGTAQDPFTLIGVLNCPAGAPYPGWGAPATPFSMSVDRNGTAWVLYTSGEIFHVNIQNAQCSPIAFQPSQQNMWFLFGMGYSTDAAGGDTETLFVAGGPQMPAPNPMAGFVDATLQIQRLPMNITAGESSPELTGTGDAALFGYFPGVNQNGFVWEIDKTTGNVIGNAMQAGAVPGGPLGWAFAHWGGKFYIFITPALGSPEVQVVERGAMGPYNDSNTISSDYVIVGAGVSTCAPVIVE